MDARKGFKFMASQTPHCGVSNDLQDRRQMADQIPPTIRFWVVAVLAVWVVGHVLVLMVVVVRISKVFRGRQCLGISGFPGGSCLPIEEFLVLTSVSVVVRCLLFHQNHSNLRIIITSHSKSVGNSKILDVADTTAGYVPYLISTPVICNREGAVPRLTFCLGIMARFFSFKFGLPVLRK